MDCTVIIVGQIKWIIITESMPHILYFPYLRTEEKEYR